MYLESSRIEAIVPQYFIAHKDLCDLLCVLVSLSFSVKSERTSLAERIRSLSSRVVSYQSRFPSHGFFFLVSSASLSPILSVLLESLSFSDSVLTSFRESVSQYAELFLKARTRYYHCILKLSELLSESSRKELAFLGCYNRASFESEFSAVWVE